MDISRVKARTKIAGTVMLFLTAFIWGIAFVPQSAAMKYIEPFTFNAARFCLAGVVLLPVRNILRYISYKSGNAEFKKGGSNITEINEFDSKVLKPDLKQINKNSIKGGVLGGLFLFIAGSMQQYGMQFTTAGKAGFITVLYIVIIPVIGFFCGKKNGVNIWVATAVSLVGMYLLCIKESLSLGKGDFYIFLSSIAFSMQILSVERFSNNSDALLFSIIEFITAGILSIPCMFIFENPSFSSTCTVWKEIAFLGIFSGGAAYTCQIVGQRYVKAAAASMIMSFEAVFALLGGAVILSERMTVKEILGCVFVFAAIIIAQYSDN